MKIRYYSKEIVEQMDQETQIEKGMILKRMQAKLGKDASTLQMFTFLVDEMAVMNMSIRTLNSICGKLVEKFLEGQNETIQPGTPASDTLQEISEQPVSPDPGVEPGGQGVAS